MTTSQPETTQLIDLKVGSSRVEATRIINGNYKYESQAFLTVPYSTPTAAFLDRDKVPHAAAVLSRMLNN